MRGPVPTAEDEVHDGRRFAFGANWQAFLGSLDEERIDAAEAALSAMLGPDGLTGRSFLDIGSGSGLSSLAALRLGAARVYSFDYDAASVACTEEVRRRYASGDGRWAVAPGNVLDRTGVGDLGRFDIVYSWGVLHHTGDMWSAIANASDAVADDGRLFIAIYNDQGGRSATWRGVKRLYNRLPTALRSPYALLVMGPREVSTALRSLVRGQFGAYVRSWSARRRGMSRWHDLLDWVGGYPFEVATPEAILDFVRPRGFELVRLTTSGGGVGCNQYVFSRRRR